LATAGGDRLIKIYKVVNFTLFKTLNDGTNKITSIIFSSNSKFLISGGYDKILRIYNIENSFELTK
jgi:WD40 repeat protein